MYQLKYKVECVVLHISQNLDIDRGGKTKITFACE